MPPGRGGGRMMVAHQWPREISVPLPADFTRRILDVDESGVSIDLPGGGSARGRVTKLRHDDDGPLLVEGEITHPEPGRFHFRRQTLPGKAGPLFGFIHFDESETAYQVRPAGEDGAPVLVRTSVHRVVCRSHAMESAYIPATHPTDDPIPPSENDIIQLQSLPGAEAVVYLDFDGEERDFEVWGYVNAAPSGAGNERIFDVWQGVSEDFQPFDINVTTIRSVFDAAAPNQRMQVIITPTDQVAPGKGGKAIIGSFNSEGDIVCWAFITTRKDAVEIISHEVGHTLGLSHHGRSEPLEEYYAGHNGWAPIMGVGYNQPLTQWSKGEYLNANNSAQDDLLVISTTNNGVAYREDDHGTNYATASWLDINEDGIAFAEGIIETNTDRDAFRFSTNGGDFTMQINPVPPIFRNPVIDDPVANLDIKAELLRVTSSLTSIIATSNPSDSMAASFDIPGLAPGDYFIRISGSGRGNVISGYSDYGSLGSYTITGTVEGGIHADRFVIAENSANGTVVGTVLPRANHSTGVISHEISTDHSGGAFEIHAATGVITVADSSLLDFEALSTRWDDPATLDFLVTINDSLEFAMETIRVVVVVADVNEPPVFEPITPLMIPASLAPGTPVTRVRAYDPDRADFPLYSIVAGNDDGTFSIDPESGEITLAGLLDFPNVSAYNLTIRATDQGQPVNEVDEPLDITLLPLPTGITAGTVVRTFYQNIPGTAVADLTGSPRFPEKPDSEVVLASFDSGTGAGVGYGSVIRGYIIPPVTGDYTFWISADNSGELLLSTDDDPENAATIATISSASGPGQWDKEPGQQSAPAGLQAGNAYYIEARHKQGFGTDHVRVAWQGPGMTEKQVIPGLWLAPYFKQFAPWAEDGSFSVRDGAAEGTLVGGLQFIEPNLGQQIQGYAITAGNEDGHFTIDETDGLIRVAAGAAFAAGEVHHLTVSATDDGVPQATGTAVAAVTVRRLDEGLHVWWQLDESSGFIARDSSGNGRDAWLNGAAVWVPRDAANNALQLNGLDAGFDLYDENSLAGGMPFTVAAWVKVPAEHEEEAVIIQQADAWGFESPGYYRVSVTGDGRVRFVVYGDDAAFSGEGFQFDLVSTEAIHDGGWHHVACVRDGESGRIFINGVESASAAGTVRLLEAMSTTSVGFDAATFSGFLDAVIDDVRIYQEALAAPQIVRIADAPKIAVSGALSSNVVIPAGVGLLLDAEASTPGGNVPAVNWSLVSGPGSVTFGPPSAEHSALFSANGSYVLRATADNGLDTVSVDLGVLVGSTASSPFAGTTIGTDGFAAHIRIGFDAYQLFGDVHGLLQNGTEDGFRLVGQSFTGDFDLRSRTFGGYDLEFDEPLGFAGLIVRAGITGGPDDVSGFIGLRPGAGTWLRREVAGAPNLVTNFSGITLPYWCRITRTGDAVEFWQSADGESWILRGSMTMAGEVLAGLCWSSDLVDVDGYASFTNVSGFTTGNIGPMVSAGADFTAETTIGIPLEGSVSDDGLPDPPGLVSLEWSVVSGPGVVDIEDVSDALTPVIFNEAGEYVLRLVADDGAVRTFDEVFVTVTDPLPVVGVAATAPDAAETGPVSGVFTVTRGVWWVGDLTVNYTLSGTAENGVDYEELPLSVVIPDGEDSVEIVVTPIPDDLVEGPETVILTLAEGDYVISGDEAVITIADSNHPPVWDEPVITAEDGEEGIPYVGLTLTSQASDPDVGDILTFAKTSGPDWLVVDEDGSLSGTPGAADAGLNQFGVRVTDQGGLFADAVLEIFVVFANLPPVFDTELPDPPPAMARIPYSGFSLADYADDPNLPQGDEIVFSLLDGPEWLEIAADGTLGGTPGVEDIGAALVEARVTDLAGAFADATFEIIVGLTVLYLDANGETPGSGAPGEIDWDDSEIWSADPDGQTATIAWMPGAVAVFSAGDDAGDCVVTVTGNPSLGALIVEQGPLLLTGGGLDIVENEASLEIAADTRIESVVTGASLTKTGDGTLTLAVSGHLLTGGLTILAGTLDIESDLTVNDGLTVEPGATLTGAGNVMGAVYVSGTLAPGAGVGTLTTGPLSLNTGARLEWEINSWSAPPGTGQDLVVAEALEFPDPAMPDLVVDLSQVQDFTDLPAEFTLISTTAGISGIESAEFGIDVSGLPDADGHWSVVQDGDELKLTYTPLTPFERWQIEQFGEQADDPAVAGELADPDRDGLPNLVEYALGTDPNESGPSGITQDMVEIEEEFFLRLTIPRNPDATDVTLTVQTTSDLSDPGSWTPLDTVIETDEPDLRVVRDTLGGPRRFIRLQVSR